MRKLIGAITFMLYFWPAAAQNRDSVLEQSLLTIGKDDLSRIVHELASDRMAGRKPGTEGIERAARVIASSFEATGLCPYPSDTSYYQRFHILEKRAEDAMLTINGKQYAPYRDFVVGAGLFQEKTTLPVEFIGNGRPFEIDSIDLNGKAALIMTPNLFFYRQGLVDTLKQMGCRAIILCNPYNEKQYGTHERIIGYGYKQSSRQLETTEKDNREIKLADFDMEAHYLPIIIVKPALVRKLTGVSSDYLKEWTESSPVSHKKPKTLASVISIHAPFFTNRVELSNILGYIEGGELKNELIVISAHYDHLGQKDGSIFYGADDNATGVSALLEIAGALGNASRMGVKPKRSVLFAAFTAEEIGLIGSKYFVKTFNDSLPRIVMNINIDMIGRRESGINHNRVYFITTKTDSALIGSLNAYTEQFADIEYKYSNEGFFSSDHANFLTKNIPFVFFFRGLHSDYHQPSDTPDKVDYRTMQAIVRTIYSFAWAYAVEGKAIR